jgi:hypothetical protein
MRIDRALELQLLLYHYIFQLGVLSLALPRTASFVPDFLRVSHLECLVTWHNIRQCAVDQSISSGEYESDRHVVSLPLQ